MSLIFSSTIDAVKNLFHKADTAVESAAETIINDVEKVADIVEDEFQKIETAVIEENTNTTEVIMSEVTAGAEVVSEVDKVAASLKALLIAAGHQIGDEYESLVEAAKALTAKV